MTLPVLHRGGSKGEFFPNNGVNDDRVLGVEREVSDGDDVSMEDLSTGRISSGVGS